MTENKNTFNSPFWDYIGMKEVESKDGVSVIELPVKVDITQRRGSVHGGVLATLVDAAIGSAVRSLLNEGEQSATVELKLNYIRPALGSKLIGKGKIINKGKNLVIGEAEILNDEGKIVTAGMATFIIIRKKNKDEMER